MGTRLRVLVVDDSAFFRHRISDLLGQCEAIEVVGSVADGRTAVSEARRLRPDVITMDVEMPGMDGITALRRIMEHQPTRVLMFSALTQDGAKATLEALDAGAVDFLPKRFKGLSQDCRNGIASLAQRVIAVGQSRLAPRTNGSAGIAPRVTHSVGTVRAAARVAQRSHPRLVAIGASTGGPVALQIVLSALSAAFPLPLIIAVHMPGTFTAAFAERLDARCQIRVREAKDGDALEPGLALLAPGGKQLLVESLGEHSVARVKDSLSEQNYRPSVDVLLGSASRLYPGRVLGVVLTGMGSDGKQGARLLKSSGSTVWTQDEASCVVYGMPQAVEKAGLSDRVLSLSEIGQALDELP